MTEENLAYYERRAREEAEAAASATTVEAASAHRLLATEYEAQARELQSRSSGGEKDRISRVADAAQAGKVDANRRPKLSIK